MTEATKAMIDVTLMPGPCSICGAEHYHLSMGGPTICPKCDCGDFDFATVMHQAKVIAGLRNELAAAKAAEGERESAVFKATHPPRMTAKGESEPNREIGLAADSPSSAAEALAAEIETLKAERGALQVFLRESDALWRDSLPEIIKATLRAERAESALAKVTSERDFAQSLLADCQTTMLSLESELAALRSRATVGEETAQTIRDAIEAIERGSSTAPVVESLRAVLALLSAPVESGWRTMDSAPKDATSVFLLSKAYTQAADVDGGPYDHPAKCAIGRWHAEGTAWADDYGRSPDDPEVDDDTISLHKTGVWYSGGGWFQPNEVTHWMPLPLPPSSPGGTRTGK